MSKQKALTLSLIIPVYNEEAHLADCLDSIGSQVVKPDEVIVVDNNSTDGSVEIAKSYKFVKLIHEPKQGLIAARNAGFNAAKSDILGRIDADAILYADWVARVKADFSQNPHLAGLTGSGINVGKSIYAIPLISKLTVKLYFWQTKGYLGVDVLWGTNMAIAAKWWRKIKSAVCLNDKVVHEDQDLSLLIAAQGGTVKIDPSLQLKFDGAKLQNFKILQEYYHRRRTTKLYHLKKATYESANLKKVKWYKRLFYSLITYPLYLFFRLTSFFYNRRAKRHMKAANRQ